MTGTCVQWKGNYVPFIFKNTGFSVLILRVGATWNPTYLTSEPLINVSTVKRRGGGDSALCVLKIATCPLATMTATFHIRPKSSVIVIIQHGYLAFSLTFRVEWLGDLRQNSQWTRFVLNTNAWQFSLNVMYLKCFSVDEGDVAFRLMLRQLRRGWIHLLLLHLPQRGEPFRF